MRSMTCLVVSLSLFAASVSNAIVPGGICSAEEQMGYGDPPFDFPGAPDYGEPAPEPEPSADDWELFILLYLDFPDLLLEYGDWLFDDYDEWIDDYSDTPTM